MSDYEPLQAVTDDGSPRNGNLSINLQAAHALAGHTITFDDNAIMGRWPEANAVE
ncbi:MAG: hypothetical protein AB7T86_04920 [Xanthobacteraceae bacterium]